MRVVLIKGQSTYDALRVFVDGLAAAFAREGHQATIIDGAVEQDLVAEMDRRAASGPTGLVFTFNILGEVRDGRGRSIGDIFGAPHVIQFVDYPFAHLARLEGTPSKAAVLMVDPSHVDAVLSIYGPDRFGFVGFCPHAASGETVSPGQDAREFAESRPIPILFAGTFYRPRTPGWATLPTPTRKVFEAAVDIALSKEWAPPLAALDKAMSDLGLNPGARDFADFRKTAELVHQHVREQRRFQLLKTANALGLPLHIVGKGYERDTYRFKNLNYRGEMSFSEVLALMNQSRVVLNVNANFGEGSHERPLSAMNAGAVAATDQSAFYRSKFRPGEEIALYQWMNLEAGLSEIGKLADHPEAAFNMARAGQRKVTAEHLWVNRVNTIIDAAERARG